MQKEHQIISLVYAAKQDIQKADRLIRNYIPFIRAEASKSMARVCTEQDDEFSISMMAFHEAVLGYQKEKGAFLNYASMLIRSRLIDYQRKEARHQGHISFDEKQEETDVSLYEQFPDNKNHYDDLTNLEATRDEIEELSTVMKSFGINFTDVSDHSPKQERTFNTCAMVIRYASENKQLLDELLRSKKLPLAQLISATGAERKTVERHRKYILAMLLIQTNGYEIIRGHLKHLLKAKGGMSV